jgi:uncharacterized protein (TIGR02271 family)
MGDFFGLFGTDNEKSKTTDESGNTMVSDESLKMEDDNERIDNGTLHLHQEELDISKNSSDLGEVTISKEIVEERKIVDVPVSHEEVVIERRSINNEQSSTGIGEEETIRIPVREEHVEVGKHTVTTGEVSAYKRSVNETQHVEETVRREEARINKTGNVNVISDDSDIHSSNGSFTNNSRPNFSSDQTSGVTDVDNDDITKVVDNNYNGDITPS